MKEDQKQSATERIWKENGFFNDQSTDLTIGKPNFPENTLCYVNNGSITPVKGGHSMYLEYVIIGQILPIANLPPNIDFDKHGYKENEYWFSHDFIIPKIDYIEVSQKNWAT